MIVPMKKLTLLVSARDRREALSELRSLGVLHVQNIKSPSSDEIYDLQNQLADIERVNVILDGDVKQAKEGISAPELLETSLVLAGRKEALQAELNEKNEAIKWFESWGKVSLASTEKLKQAGLFVRFYSTDKDGFKDVPAEAEIVTVQQSKEGIKFAYFGKSEEDKLDLNEQRMPQAEVSELESRITKIEGELETISSDIAELFPHKAVLADHQAGIEKKLELNNVLYGMGDEGQFAYLQGYCPEDKVKDVETASETNGWGIIIDEPDDPSQVPTLLRNRKPAAWLEPLLKFMGTLPGYHEMDVSFTFLAFFSVFYAMIIGDAGYGLIFLVGTIFARIKMKNAPAEPFALFFILSSATLIWGFLTGTWFGSKAIAELPFLQPFIIENMYSFNNSEAASQFMKQFAFIVGAAQLIIGRLLAISRKLKTPHFLADVGWILITVFMYFLAQLLVNGKAMPNWPPYLLGAGMFLVMLFTNFQKNIFKAIGGSIITTLLDTISSFSDVVSYIRLYAVGIASVTVAASFNDMAGGLAAPLILIFGHGLNIILGLMSVLVHGVRLNMLEFSGALGQEWSGKDYQPFKE
jgi:V/A-type H+/Na+-transporting ATPase subunit I